MPSHYLENLWAQTAQQTAIEFVRHVLSKDDRLCVLAAAVQRLGDAGQASKIRLGQVLGVLRASNEALGAPLLQARPAQAYRRRRSSQGSSRARAQAARRLTLRLLEEAPGGGGTTGQVREALENAGHPLSSAATYALMNGMRGRGWVAAEGDQHRKIWRITPEGRRALFKS